MASTAIFLVLIITMGELTTLGSAGGSARELTPPGSAGGSAGELAPLASAGGSAGALAPLASAGGRARGKSELTTTPGSAGGSAGGLTATPPGSAGGSASELMPAGSAGGSATTTTAGISPLLQKELALLDLLGSNCSFDCMACLLETIGSCLAHAVTCVHPLTMVKCFVGKFIIIEHCFGTGELTTTPGSAGGSELTTPPGSAGGSAGELTTPGSAGGSATTTAGVSALLRQELALADLGSNCSDNCMQCLRDNIWSCSVDAVICVDLWDFLRCLVEKFIAFKECFGTKQT